jgi:hypothetical protein
MRPDASSLFAPDIVQLVSVTCPLPLVVLGPVNEPLKLDE